MAAVKGVQSVENMRNEPGVVGCMGLWDLWIKGWRHREVLPHSPSTLEFSQRPVSYAWMPMTKKTWSITFNEKICSILNHPDLPLKCSDGCWIGTRSLLKTLAKHLFHKKSGNPSETLFWKCIVEKSHLQVLFQDVVQQLTPKNLQRITTNPEHLWLPQLEPPVSKPVRLIESILLIYINLLWLDDIFLSVTTPFSLHNACPANLGKVEVRWHRCSPRNLQLEWMTST